MVHNYYDAGAVTHFNFNTLIVTKGNKFRLQKFTFHYNIRKYTFCYQVVRTLTCDTRTDRRTHDDSIYHASIASCCKNCSVSG